MSLEEFCVKDKGTRRDMTSPDRPGGILETWIGLPSSRTAEDSQQTGHPANSQAGATQAVLAACLAPTHMASRTQRSQRAAYYLALSPCPELLDYLMKQLVYFLPLGTPHLNAACLVVLNGVTLM